jgi:hypothetical protein
MLVEKLALDRRLGRLQAGEDSGTMLATWSVALSLHTGNIVESDTCGTSYKLGKADCSQASLNAALPWRYEAQIKTVQTFTPLNNANNIVARSKMWQQCRW